MEKFKYKYLKYKHKYLKYKQQAGALLPRIDQRLIEASFGSGVSLQVEHNNTIMDWGVALHRYGNELSEEALEKIFKSALLYWYIHDIVKIQIPEAEAVHMTDQIFIPRNDSSIAYVLNLARRIFKNIPTIWTPRMELIYSVAQPYENFLGLRHKDRYALIEKGPLISQFRTHIHGNLEPEYVNIVRLIQPLFKFDYSRIGRDPQIINIGIAYQRLKIILEKIQTMQSIDSHKIYKLDKLLDILQTMIYNHINVKIDFIYNNFENSFIHEKPFNVEKVYEQLNTYVPTFYNEPEYITIMQHIEILKRPISDDNLALFTLPQSINDILQLSQINC